MLKNNKGMKCLFITSTVRALVTMAVAMLAFMTVISIQVPVEVQAQGQQLQQQQPQETFFESAVRNSNESSVSEGQQQQQQPQPSAATEPTLNSDFVWQGQVSSQPVQLREGEEPQSAIILPIRDDRATYSGIITHHASKPVDLVVLNVLNPGNTTAIPEEFGELDDIIRLNGQLVSVNEIGSGESGSMPFTGNALGFISDEEGPFLVTYTLTAVPEQARTINDITSVLAFNATSSEEATETSEEDEDDEGE
jgi:hypothetical protein